MARQTYILRDGKLVPKDQAVPLHSNSSAYVIPDSISPTWHPGDGKTYESKSKFRRATRAAGCEEVGTSKVSDKRRFDSVSKTDVARAVEMVRSGYRPTLETLD